MLLCQPTSGYADILDAQHGINDLDLVWPEQHIDARLNAVAPVTQIQRVAACMRCQG